MASLAEAASLQLELKYLSHLTGDYVYWKKAEKVSSSSGPVHGIQLESRSALDCCAKDNQVSEIIRGQAIYDGIAPIFIA